ncbi:MAG: hypothetical protein ABR582_01790 [Gemmatimonadaceae bacterium]
MKSLALVCFFGFSLTAQAQSRDCVAKVAASEGGRTSTGRSTIIEPARLQPDNQMPGLVRGEPSHFVVSVVVDTVGRADSTTIQFPPELDAFAVNAIRNAIPGWRFTPAKLGGCPVKQVVRLSFTRK